MTTANDDQKYHADAGKPRWSLIPWYAYLHCVCPDRYSEESFVIPMERHYQIVQAHQCLVERGFLDDVVLRNLFARALEEVSMNDVVRVFEYGAKKYADHSWRKVPDAQPRYTESVFRHYAASMNEKTDRESGLPHMAHLAADALILLGLELELRVNVQAR